MNKLKLPPLLAMLSVFASPLTLANKMSDEQIAKADYKQELRKLTPLQGTTPAQWRITMTGDTSSTATVSWSTALAGKKHTLHYGTKPFGADVAKYQYHVATQSNGAYSRDAKEVKNTKVAYYHHCALKNLKPDTKYYFVMESDGKLSRQFYFITSPKRGDFKLIAGGDSRTGHANRVRMNLRIAKLFSENPDIYAFCHGGDFINSGRKWREWRLWLSHNELTTLDDGRVLPIIPTKGNHDGGPLFFEIFNLKSRTDKHSYWDTAQVTKDVNIITLDTNYTANGPQAKWLELQLKELRPKSRYLLTNYHRPLFPAVKKPADQARVFVPLFEKYNVDLAIESDGHCIKRTAPIRNGKIDPTGIVYIGEGGLGVGQRKPTDTHWYLKGGVADRGHHVYLLSFSDKILQCETVLLDGKVSDSFKLKPRKK